MYIPWKKFWEKVVRSPGDDCWEWKGSFSGNGYPQFQWKILVDDELKPINRAGHRLMAAFWYKSGYLKGIDGQVVRHSCDNPRCVNPMHLWLGDQQTNLREMHDKGRWQLRLSARDAEEIRKQAKNLKHCEYKALADLYKVSERHIQRIVAGEQW